MVTAGPPRVEEPDAPKRDRRMSLAQHLVELRRRAIIGAIALVVGMIIAALISNQVIDLLTVPIAVISESRGSDLVALNFPTATAGFDFHIRIAFAIGIILSAPVWLWQIWAFIMPGLTRKEVKYTVGFLSAAIPLFFAGCALGLWVTPHVIEVMATFVPEQGSILYQYDLYYDFVLKLLLVIGVAFVLPVFLVALNFAGIISGVAILKGWRVAVLSATIFAAIATPAADVLSMLMLAGILIVLYVVAAALSMLFDRRRSKREESFLSADSTQ